ncbi:MAG: metallophosphoesterase [Candidatus Micrarchaeota archaeon]|nr:metallophosphoesterase [Candidatus Micrarchaeota archaeon]
MLKYLYNEPAVLCGRSLVISDLHLGITAEMFAKGTRVGPQAEQLAGKAKRLIEENKAKRLVILGDVKHTVPSPSGDEKNEVERFFAFLREVAVEIVIVRGNHDGGIEKWAREAGIVGSGGVVLGGVGFAHGHAWPSKEVMMRRNIVTSHIHPGISIVDKLGARNLQPAWAICGINPAGAAGHYAQFNKKLEMTVMPAFNPLVGAMPLNEASPEGIPGPLFRNETFKLDECKIYLLDGTCMGNVSNLRKRKR